MHVLIVDDEEINREILGILLEDYATVTMAETGQEAVEAVTAALDRGDYFNLICMDIVMPGMNGHDALKIIRGLEESRQAPRAKAIMVTASVSTDDILDALLVGDCDDYLNKPVIRKDLIAVLEKHGLLT